MKFQFETQDKQVFVVEREIIEQSVTIKNMLSDLGDESDAIIPLPSVNGKIMKKVIEYCTHHHNESKKEDDDQESETTKEDDDQKSEKQLLSPCDDIAPWDKEFCEVDQPTLFEMITAANYLDIKPLLELTCKTVANMIRGKTPDEIRKTFNIKGEFTPEEEKRIREENEWAMDL